MCPRDGLTLRRRRALALFFTVSNTAPCPPFPELTGRAHFHHRRYIRVTDPKVALRVLKGVTKGDGLESRLALPAWAPVLSIESVDGELWRTMRADFDRVHKLVAPRTADLALITKRHVDAALARGGVVDADAITRITLGIFLELLFGPRDCSVELDVLARASWEWRKEIACKGKGCKDAKAAAVEATLSLLRADAELWDLFEEDWADPRRCVLHTRACPRSRARVGVRECHRGLKCVRVRERD